jgi:NosR/NirI family transcriptional regulator, nitrous oxide reductase regulator
MRRLWKHILGLLLVTGLPLAVWAQERFPPPEFRSGYELPTFQTATGRSAIWNAVDVGLLLVALSLASYAAIKWRSRRAVLLLSIASVAYFGFYRKGCVCPVGSVQNVAMATFGDYALPWTVGLFFLLPLLFTLIYGRVFCAGVCPLGAIQDLVLVKAIQVPRWIESALGLLAWAYLGLAVLFAATGADFVICRYDPFVGFFRFSATPQMLMLGGVLLVGGMFVGRIYCRIFCPYGIIMRWLSPIARYRVSISPTQCVDCRLCEQSCPFGAIRYPTRRPITPPSTKDRRRLAIMLAVIPLLMVLGAVLGYYASPTFSTVHRDVRLAGIVAQSQQPRPASDRARPAKEMDELTAFRNGTRTPQELFTQAGLIQRRFAIGSALFGAFMGLAVGLKLSAHSLRRGSKEYLADPGACVACARCFKDCPVEQERLAGRPILT